MGISCAGDFSPYGIRASNILSSSLAVGSTISFSVDNFRSPPTTVPSSSDSITVTVYNSAGFQINTCTTTPTGLTPRALTDISIQPVTSIPVNSVSSIRFDFTLTDRINNLDTFRITFPPEVRVQYSRVTLTGASGASASSSSSSVDISQNLNFARNFTVGTSFFISLEDVVAPPSTQQSSDISLQVFRDGRLMLEGTGTLQAEATQITSVLGITLSTVSEETNYQFQITLPDPLSSAGYIEITLPVQISIDSKANCASASGTSIISSPTCAISGSTVRIDGLSTGGDIPAQTMEILLLDVTNPASTQTSDYFTVRSYYSSSATTLVSQGTIPGITATQRAILVASVTPASLRVLDTAVTYTVAFTNQEELAAGSNIHLRIPRELVVEEVSISANCKIGLNAATPTTATCLQVSNSATDATHYSIRYSLAALAPAGTNIALELSDIITNPDSTRATPSFQLQTENPAGFAV